MKLIILDRDGVINHDSDDYIKTVDEWIPIEGSLQAMSKLYNAGYRVVIATNQSGIARGYFDIETLHAMHQKMEQMLAQLGGKIEAVYYCPHGPDSNCKCRKPKDGMFQEITKRYQCGLLNVPAIGDSLRDIQAARKVNATPILVRTGEGERTLASATKKELKGVAVYQDLAEAVDAILAENKK